MTPRWLADDRDRKGRNLRRLATKDEVVPRSHGGPKTWENQVAACFMCNQGRGSINATVYFEKVQEVGRRKAAAWGRTEQSRRDADRDRAAVEKAAQRSAVSL
jgi:hypothetical protein